MAAKRLVEVKPEQWMVSGTETYWNFVVHERVQRNMTLPITSTSISISIEFFVICNSYFETLSLITIAFSYYPCKIVAKELTSAA